MAFTPKEWKNAPNSTTPISAEALIDLETRVTNYAKESGGTILNVKTVSSSGAAYTILAPTEFNITDLTLSANCTITLPSPVKGTSFTLYRRQPATGGPYTVTWVGSVKWPEKIPPELTEEANAVDVISFQSPDGVALYGFPVLNLG
jgi:hypothetical protein